jgi:formamidopyrimidine-DNA glycosylase
MPELPELTVFAENLSKAVVGKTIASALCPNSKRLNVPAEEFAGAVESAKVDRVERVGKEICLHLSRGAFLWIHLMLKGGFVRSRKEEVGKLDDLVLALLFSDGSALAVTDPRGMARIALKESAAAKAPDALDLSTEFLQEEFRKKPKALVKAFLIDQERIGGIGNAYSDEILWLARISPKSVVGKLPPEAVEALARAIPAVLDEAMREIRKRRPDTVAGEIREFLKVHVPGKKLSPTGGRIVKEQVGGKTTYYTDEQVLYQ